MTKALIAKALAVLNSDTQDAQRNAAAAEALRSAEARSGDSLISYHLGELLFEGKVGVPCDKEAAAACLLRAVRQLESSPDCMVAEQRGRVRPPPPRRSLRPCLLPRHDRWASSGPLAGY